MEKHRPLSISAVPIATKIEEIVESIVGRKIGFMLILSDDGRPTYIGNVHRAEAVEAIRTLLDKWERNETQRNAEA